MMFPSPVELIPSPSIPPVPPSLLPNGAVLPDTGYRVHRWGARCGRPEEDNRRLLVSGVGTRTLAHSKSLIRFEKLKLVVALR